MSWIMNIVYTSFILKLTFLLERKHPEEFNASAEYFKTHTLQAGFRVGIFAGI